MENEDYITMFYNDLIKYNIKKIKHKIYIDDLSIINDHNPFDIEDIRNIYINKDKTRNRLSAKLIGLISTNIFMGLDRDYDKWYYLDLLVSCLDINEEIEKLKPLVNNVADNIMYIRDIIHDHMDRYRVDNHCVALDKIVLTNVSPEIIGTFVAFEEVIKYE